MGEPLRAPVRLLAGPGRTLRLDDVTALGLLTVFDSEGSRRRTAAWSCRGEVVTVFTRAKFELGLGPIPYCVFERPLLAVFVQL
jgi:hypothetical protein